MATADEWNNFAMIRRRKDSVSVPAQRHARGRHSAVLTHGRQVSLSPSFLSRCTRWRSAFDLCSALLSPCLRRGCPVRSSACVSVVFLTWESEHTVVSVWHPRYSHQVSLSFSLLSLSLSLSLSSLSLFSLSLSPLSLSPLSLSPPSLSSLSFFLVPHTHSLSQPPHPLPLLLHVQIKLEYFKIQWECFLLHILYPNLNSK
jgi:hypothetical protein